LLRNEEFVGESAVAIKQMLETSLGYDANGNYNVGDPHVNQLILSTPIISSGNGGASSCLIQMLWIYRCGSK
jgi:hypothetical protein